MSEMTFESVPIPEDDAPEPDTSNDPTCRVCGAALTYGGRGRKPVLCETHKRTGTTAARGPRTSGDVDSALVILGGLYDGLSAGLMLASPTAASMWVQRIDSLQASNRAILTADKDLCRRINNLARGGGKFAFVAAHAMALGPVVMVLRMEMVARSQARAQAAPTDFISGLNGVTIPDETPAWLQ